jgi:scyllo-inositol 2-dehydrogenase (NADP+)
MSACTLGVVVVGFGLAGRSFHAPLIKRQPALRLVGFVARDPERRTQAREEWGVEAFSDIETTLSRPDVDIVVLATPHDTHAPLAIQVLQAGKHCVVDKVMALRSDDADRMIAARDAHGQMLSVFHNRRWDWDFAALRSVLDSGLIGRPLLIESSVCRDSIPRTWRGRSNQAGTILHDWGAHLVDQALLLQFGPCRRVFAWMIPHPDPAVDTGGHGRIVMEFDHVVFSVETSRIATIERARWWVQGTDGGFVKFGLDPQEAALRASNLDLAAEEPDARGLVRRRGQDPTPLPTLWPRPSWDAYYANIARHLTDGEPLAVTAEQAREVVRVLEAATLAAAQGSPVEGTWEF